MVDDRLVQAAVETLLTQEERVQPSEREDRQHTEDRDRPGAFIDRERERHRGDRQCPPLHQEGVGGLAADDRLDELQVLAPVVGIGGHQYRLRWAIAASTHLVRLSLMYP